MKSPSEGFSLGVSEKQIRASQTRNHTDSHIPQTRLKLVKEYIATQSWNIMTHNSLQN